LLTLNNFFDFFKNKNTVIKEKKIQIFFYFVLLMVFIVYLSNTLSTFVIYVIDVDTFNFLTQNFQKKAYIGNKFTNVFFLLLYFPLLEELVYRLPLRIKKYNLLISAFLFIFFLQGQGLKDFYTLNNVLFFKIIIFFLISVFLFYKEKIMIDFLNQYFSYFFYFITFVFAFSHIWNFVDTLTLKNFYLIPLLIPPYLISGYFFGFFRVKFGFLWGLLAHTIMNIPVVLIYIITK
jgi:hypothetical protein